MAPARRVPRRGRGSLSPPTSPLRRRRALFPGPRSPPPRAPPRRISIHTAFFACAWMGWDGMEWGGVKDDAAVEGGRHVLIASVPRPYLARDGHERLQLQRSVGVLDGQFPSPSRAQHTRHQELLVERHHVVARRGGAGGRGGRMQFGPSPSEPAVHVAVVCARHGSSSTSSGSSCGGVCAVVRGPWRGRSPPPPRHPRRERDHVRGLRGHESLREERQHRAAFPTLPKVSAAARDERGVYYM